ncbi:hypothetical protein EMGBS1_06680 [Chloroflexota bacterium]|nr:hypothetical protein EMGBS1_06680 [Chloroflexota bacterium]
MICFAITDYLDGYSKKVMGTDPHARYDLNDDRIAERAGSPKRQALPLETRTTRCCA